MNKEKISFRKYNWVVVTKKRIMPCNEIYYKYRVYRKYFKQLIPLSNTKCSYEVSQERWNYLKRKVKYNPNFIPQMELWSGQPR